MKDAVKKWLLAIFLTVAFCVGLGFGVKKLVDDAARDRFTKIIDIHQRQPLVPLTPSTPIKIALHN